MSKPSTVLIVDDEIGPRESLRAILKPEHQILVATTGEQAIKMVEESPVDVVLLDLRMPGISGMCVLERIKELNPTIEVILITGYASYETVLGALRLHAFDYIPKPFNIPELRNKVRLAVTRHYDYSRRAEDEDTKEQETHGESAPQSMTFAPGPQTREENDAVLRGNVEEPLQVIKEGSQILLSQYSQRLDARGKETLQRVHDAAQTLTKGLNAVLPQQSRWATPPWSASPVSMSSSNVCS
ncbi:MAG: response regulator [Candidatus Binatia bacterium]